ncbi:helix-turn-helix domain-containing protein [Xanthomonas sp. WHRI 7945]|nr:helix-turn-helix domain-containing protein [Xanthomonas campestris pv. campestris]
MRPKFMQSSSLTPSPDQANAPRLYSINGACAALGGMGRTWLYEQIKLKRLRTVKLGRRTMIPASELESLIASQLESAA